VGEKEFSGGRHTYTGGGEQIVCFAPPEQMLVITESVGCENLKKLNVKLFSQKHF
jgi:hypothetical protein